MKPLIVLALLLMSGIANATNYYFSSVNGDDSRTVAQAQNPATPWKTISKLNSYFSNLAAGDSVLFKRGETFYGSIAAGKSGTSISPIKIGSYGSGAKPIITGFTAITNWTNLGNNIWESTSAVSTLSTCNIISLNGINTAYGRMPKTGYWTALGTTATSITDATHLNAATTDWTGANIAARTVRWHLDRATVTSVSGNTISFSGFDYSLPAGWGYFIQNHPSCLTQQNDWCYISSTQKVKIYSTSAPVNVSVPTINEAVTLNTSDYITFDNLNFQGYNTNGINTNSRTGITIQNCDFSFIADIAVQTVGNGNKLIVKGCTFIEVNNGGVHAKNSTNNLIQNNVFTNVGNIPGMGGSGDLGYTAIYTYGDNAQVLYNSITRTGYVGIRWDGNAVLIKGNFINYTNYIKDDGGGIYCYPNNGTSTQNQYTQRTVRDNISLNALGAVAGGEPAGVAQGYCIFNDGSSPNINYVHNTMSGGRFGLFMQGGYDCLIDSNTVYGATQIGIYFTNSTTNPITNNTITNNIAVTNVSNAGIGCGSGKYAMDVYGISSLPSTWTAANNIYANPLDQTNGWIYSVIGTGSPCKTLADWQSQTGKDAGSTGSPLIVSDISKIRFEYNETSVPKTVSLGANYIDMRSASYPGTIIIAPYSSTVLLKISTGNVAPTANAGPDQTITLPTAIVNLSGIGTDADGTITSYAWTKISGPTSGAITSATSASTTVTGMVQGLYKFELKVTDNSAAVGRDTMQVTVNAAVNVAPIANAGVDQIITLPVNSVSLSGIGTDADGTIASYAWTKISGPISGTITNATSASTTVTGMLQGVYKFELKVTDNSGATGRDTMQVNVNAANQIPVANAGADKTITVPATSITLTGTGTDADGAIASFAWTKVSGPAGATITNATSASTTMTGLVLGIYKFELKVTDNNGAIGRDTMQLYVNASNLGPIANAGADRNISSPANSITLTGSGTDPDGAITSYAWTKISGPASGIITSATSATTTVTSLIQGVYKFELRVTDNSGGIGAIGRDTMQVTVNAAVNQFPVANAGADKTITLPINNATLSGGGTDADGTIASFTWTKISGPATFNITNPASASTTVTALVQGVYAFELKVTDNAGATGRDTIQVTVNGSTNTPYTGTPIPIPGTIEVEDYDNGGQNIAYNDVTSGNSGGVYRPLESVDLGTATEGGAYIGWTNDNEWTKYTVNVTSSGIYSMLARVSTFSNIASFRVEMDGVTIATVSIPNTGGYQTWQNVTIPNIPLTAGIKVMRFYFVVGGFNITRLVFTQTSASRNNPLITSSGSNQSIVSPPTTTDIVSIYPNPVSTSAKVMVNNTIPGVYQLSLSDILGKKVWKKTLVHSIGLISETINTAAMLNGVYVLEVISPDHKRKTYKIIKN